MGRHGDVARLDLGPLLGERLEQRERARDELARR